MQHTTELAERLAGIANELLQLAKSLGNTAEASEPQFPEEAVRNVVAGICLNCGKSRSETGLFRRGNCPSCSNKINKELRESRLPRLQVERQLIADGLLAPKDFKLEPDPIKKAIAKVESLADHHFADPSIKPPGRKRRASKK